MMTEGHKGPQVATAHGRRAAREECRIHDSIEELHTKEYQPCQHKNALTNN